MSPELQWLGAYRPPCRHFLRRDPFLRRRENEVPVIARSDNAVLAKPEA